MEKLGLNQLREQFINFYIGKGHYPAKSASLIPKHDKSLLLINSGMAPLKAYFSGAETPPAKRMTTCQKCIRTGDMENVGKTSRHGTFFEMLGNFSFGDYFKRQSLEWGWEFITQVLKMPTDKLWATIYTDDDEAYNIWKDLGMPEDRIVRLGKEDNFWEIGLGPCGPCSEIYFDRGEEFGCTNPDCKPGCECDRYVEFWNHVFTQFCKEDEETYSKLEHPNIDTGMGLERLACIMQGVDSIFDIDTIRYILDGVVEVSGITYHDGQKETDISIRIITDHLRSMVFMIGDGITPSNEGRGYVLRRLIRRAARHGMLLGLKEPFLYLLAHRVVEVSGAAYEEIKEQEKNIQKIIKIEEEKFSQTLDQGIEILKTYMKELSNANEKILSGEKAFKLYDTYGFPLELTEEILEENGITVDSDGFNIHMEKQRQLARAGRHAEDEEGWKTQIMDLDLPKTQFIGYDRLSDTASVIKVVGEGDTLKVFTDRTTFYGESGGQVADSGIIESDTFSGVIREVQKNSELYCHFVSVVKGSLKEGDIVTLSVNPKHRHRTARNHTATHILQQALKDVLGDHVKQAGSLVTPLLLRFDFTHYQGLTEDEINKIEHIVNEQIDLFLDVKTEIMNIEDAIASGATALFDEKYGDKVRVVSCGNYCKDLCGGTHVSNTGQIGAFKIISESGIASGTRRIEGLTGSNILYPLEENDEIINQISHQLKTSKKAILNKVISLRDENKSLQKELTQLKEQSLIGGVEDLLQNSYEKDGITLVTRRFDGISVDDLRNLSDTLKEHVDKGIFVLVAVNDAKANVIVSVTDKLVSQGYHAGKLIKEITKVANGRGGGKADMAQGGIGDIEKIDDTFLVAQNLI